MHGVVGDFAKEERIPSTSAAEVWKPDGNDRCEFRQRPNGFHDGADEDGLASIETGLPTPWPASLLTFS
jgi:hypothetical protein